jgi:hypothetical protein
VLFAVYLHIRGERHGGTRRLRIGDPLPLDMTRYAQHDADPDVTWST